jgi:hypothetical protein
MKRGAFKIEASPGSVASVVKGKKVMVGALEHRSCYKNEQVATQ